VVDFGDQARLPTPVRRPLQAWLGLFGVTPRAELSARLGQLAERMNRPVARAQILRGYCEKLTLTV
jgi:hypothetical protein